MKALLRWKYPDIVFLLETRLYKNEWKTKIKEPGFSDGRGVAAGANRAGDLLLMWREEVQVAIKDITLHYIDAKVKMGNCKQDWRLTVVYGWSKVRNKYQTCDLLHRLHQQVQIPWLVVGDFNLITDYLEKSGSREPYTKEMDMFRDCLENCGLEDCGYYGRTFTWENNREAEYYTEERLDRAVSNKEWIECYPDMRVYHLERCGSYHIPIQIKLVLEEEEITWGWSFRYERYWEKHDDCAKVIKDGWMENGSIPIMDRIKCCENKLRSWSKEAFGSLKQRSVKAEDAIKALNKRKLTNAVLLQKKVLE
ncbi:unnamed protein product [Linum trigynum]